MPKTVTPPKPPRPTFSQQVREQHELLMAMATKAPRQGSQTVTLAERTTGANNGDLYIKVDLVQRDKETDADFIARMRQFTTDCLAVRDDLNAAQAETRAAGTTQGGDD